MYKFEEVEGTQTKKPAEIDTTSSEYVVYIRDNIKSFEREENGVQIKGYKYRECQVPNNDFLADFVKQLVEQNELLKEQNEALKTKMEEDNLIIMGGIAETFETIIGDEANG